MHGEEAARTRIIFAPAYVDGGPLLARRWLLALPRGLSVAVLEAHYEIGGCAHEFPNRPT